MRPFLFAVIFFIFMIACIVLLSSFYKKSYSSTDSSSIGDVRYSILEPDRFISLNPGWILMDGRASKQSDTTFQNSELYLKYHVKKLPDARGVFIRGMNENRGTDSGDADKNRFVGALQFDAIKKHTHNTSVAIGYFCIQSNNNIGPGGNSGNGMMAVHPECTLEIRDIGKNLDGDETRPRNIALYTYIKVN
jgi:hypothetical protein